MLTKMCRKKVLGSQLETARVHMTFDINMYLYKEVTPTFIHVFFFFNIENL